MGAGYQLMVAGEIHQIFVVGFLRRDLAAVDVQHIADGLKGVKRDADRQGNLRHRELEAGEEIKVFDQEAAVLKDAQHPQIKNKRGRQRKLHPPCLAALPEIFNAFGPGVVQKGGKHQHEHPHRFPPGIEKKRESEQHDVLPGPVFDHKIQNEVERQKQIDKEQI